MSEVSKYAKAYHDLGWKLLRLGNGEDGKAPRGGDGWQKPKHIHLPEDFKDGDNIGIKLGASGICDIDCDRPEARFLMNHVLAYAKRQWISFGRKSAWHSHYVVECDEPGDSFKLLIHAETRKLLDTPKDKATIIEWRTGDGQYTMFPPSFHKEAKEQVKWNWLDATGKMSAGVVPTKFPKVKRDHIKLLLQMIDGLTHVMLHYPRERSARHEACNALLCWLHLQPGFNKWSPEDLGNFVREIAKHCDDEQWNERALNEATQCAKADDEDTPTTGLPRLCELFGIPEAVQKHIRECLGGKKRGRPSQGGNAGSKIVEAANIIKEMGIKLRYNQLSHMIHVEGLEGWDKPVLDDLGINILMRSIAEKSQVDVSDRTLKAVVSSEAYRNRFHPVRKYLDALPPWDGVERLDTWLIRLAGADNDNHGLTRAISSMPFIAAVRRVYVPGIKFDNALILQGPQEYYKSSAFEALAVNEDWFSDSLELDSKSREAIEQTQGKWIIECAELKGLANADIDGIKAYLSRKTDRARMAYGQMVTEEKRQFIVVGTANPEELFTDPTGNRRFWPVTTKKKIDMAALRQEIPQFWAEAKFRHERGDPIWLSDELKKALEERNLRYTTPDIAALRLEEQLAHINEGRITTLDVYKLIKQRGDLNKSDQRRATQAMASLGWAKSKKTFKHKDGKQLPCFVKGKDAHEIAVLDDGEGGLYAVLWFLTAAGSALLKAEQAAAASGIDYEKDAVRIP